MLKNFRIPRTGWLTGMPLIPVEALPRRLPDSSSTVYAREDRSDTTYTGERPTDRTLFVALSIFVLITMSLLIGSRFDGLRRNAVMKRNITSILIIALYVFNTLLTTSLAIMLVGQGVPTYRLCFAATWLCLVLYAMSKSIIYLFLVERIHVVRAPYVRRRQDKLYLACTVCMCIIFGGIVINAWLHPYIYMNPDNGRCHMGVPRKVTLPFLLIDLAVDVVYTCVFIYLLRPVIKKSDLPSVLKSFGTKQTSEGVQPITPERETRESAVQKSIKTLLWKSIIAAFAVTLVTIGLFIVQYNVQQGKGVALICSCLCLLDVFWGYIVIYWLTFSSAKAEKDLDRSLRDTNPKTNTSSQSYTFCEPCAIEYARILNRSAHSGSLPTPLSSSIETKPKTNTTESVLSISSN